MPTLVYKYHVLPPKDPEQKSLLEEAFFQSKQLKNKLIEIANEERSALRSAKAKAAPKVKAIVEEIEGLNVQLDALYEKRRARNNKVNTALVKAGKPPRKVTKSKDPLDVEREKEIKVLNTKRTQLWEKVSAYELSKAEKEKHKSLVKEIRDQTKAKKKEAYTFFHGKEGVSLNSKCTYTNAADVDKAMMTTSFKKNIKFKEYKGQSVVSWQMKNKPCPWFLQAGKGFVKIDPVSDEAFSKRKGPSEPGKGYRSLQKTTVYIQVFQRDKKQYIDLPMRMHRPLPEDGIVDTVELRRDEKGKMSLIFKVNRESHVRHNPKKGKAMINICTKWDKETNLIEVATVIRDGKSEKIQLSMDSLKTRQREIRAKSICDKELLLAQERIKQFLQENECPEWFTEAAASVTRTRSFDKFYKFVNKWRANRFEGDEVLFGTTSTKKIDTVKGVGRKTTKVKVKYSRKGTILDTYYQLRHLDQYRKGMRARFTRKRDQMYKDLAVELASDYKKVILSKEEADTKGLTDEESSMLKEVASQYKLFRNILSMKDTTTAEIIDLSDSRGK